MKKVLVATHSHAGTGAAMMLLAIIAYWVKHLGWKVDVLFDARAKAPEELTDTGAGIVDTANPAAYDFALVNTLNSANYVGDLAPVVRTVLWVHEGEAILRNSTFSTDWWQQLFRLPWKNIFQTAWQAESVFKTFLLTTPPERIVCVMNGLPPVPAGITHAPKAQGMKRIVFVGGVYDRKRPQDLVDAILGLGRNDVECVFIGSTEHIGTVGTEHVAKIRAHPQLFKLTGQLDRMQGLAMLASGEAFCLPSSDESQPIAPLEAAALGVPSLLSALPPYVGIWTHGLNCLTHPAGNVGILRWNLKAVLEDAAIHSATIQGARQLLPRFTIESFLQRFTAEMPA